MGSVFVFHYPFVTYNRRDFGPGVMNNRHSDLFSEKRVGELSLFYEWMNLKDP